MRDLLAQLGLGSMGCTAMVALCLGLFALLTLLTQALWNYLVPTVFGLPGITSLQAGAMLLLTTLLFRSVSK